MGHLVGQHISLLSVIVVVDWLSHREGCEVYDSPLDSSLYLIFVVPCIMLNSEIQQDATIAFILRIGFILHVSGDSFTHHQEYNAVYGLSGRQVYLCCNFVNILVVLSLSVVLSCR